MNQAPSTMNLKIATTTESSMHASRCGPWKKPKGRPKRPLSAYNLYFQVERARILKYGMRRNNPLVYYPEEVIRMSKWHKVRPRRPHRKSHGRVSFQDLARMISARWKDLDETNRQVFIDQAKVEKADYVRRVKIWEAETKAAQEEEEEKAKEASSFPATTITKSRTPKKQNGETKKVKHEMKVMDDGMDISDTESVARAAAEAKPYSLEHETSTSSFESFDSLNLMNEELFELEVSELGAEMEIYNQASSQISLETEAGSQRTDQYTRLDQAMVITDASESETQDDTELSEDAEDELLMMLCLANHHQNLFGMTRSSSTFYTNKNHGNSSCLATNDLVEVLDGELMESLFNDE